MAPHTNRHAPNGAPVQNQGLWWAVCVCGTAYTGGSQKRATNRLRAHVQESNRIPCPHPARHGYRWRMEAEKAALRVWKRMEGGPPLHAYRCVCNRWHLIRKTEEPGRG